MVAGLQEFGEDASSGLLLGRGERGEPFLGVAGQCAVHPAELAVGAEGEPAAPLQLPQAGQGELQQRQLVRPAREVVADLLGEPGVEGDVAGDPRRADDGEVEVVGRHRPQVVPVVLGVGAQWLGGLGEQPVEVGPQADRHPDGPGPLGQQPVEQVEEDGPLVGPALGEDLLELVDDQQQAGGARGDADGTGHAGQPALGQPVVPRLEHLDRVGQPGAGRFGDRPDQAGHRVVARPARAHRPGALFAEPGHQPGRDRRRLADARPSGHQDERLFLDGGRQFGHDVGPAEEEGRVGLGERAEAAIGVGRRAVEHLRPGADQGGGADDVHVVGSGARRHGLHDADHLAGALVPDRAAAVAALHPEGAAQVGVDLEAGRVVGAGQRAGDVARTGGPAVAVRPPRADPPLAARPVVGRQRGRFDTGRQVGLQFQTGDVGLVEGQAVARHPADDGGHPGHPAAGVGREGELDLYPGPGRIVGRALVGAQSGVDHVCAGHHVAVAGGERDPDRLAGGPAQDAGEVAVRAGPRHLRRSPRPRSDLDRSRPPSP